MATIIGIDVSKNDFYACLAEAGTPIVFENNKTGIKKFTAHLHKEHCAKEETVIGLESTGVYHLPLSYHLTEAGFTVKVINPLVTSKATKATIRKVKNDRKDSETIRHCTANGAGNVFTDTKEILELKSLVRQRNGLAEIRDLLKAKQRNVDYKHKHLGIKVEPVYEKIISRVEKEIDDFEHKLKTYRTPEQRLLRSIPGVGPITAVCFISEIDDVNRFSNAQKLAAYIGLDSRVYQSGTSIKGKGFISKRGSKILRTILFNAASVAVLRPNMFKTFFDHLRAQGKPYRVALVAVMNKMVHVIYSVWRSGRPFEDRTKNTAANTAVQEGLTEI
jgi:transposase